MPQTKGYSSFRAAFGVTLGLMALAFNAGAAAIQEAHVKPGSQEAEVLAVERIRTAALVAVDLATLETITDASYTHVESSGTARSKAEFLDGLEKGVYRFERFIIDENRVRIFGDTAVVTGTYRNVIRTKNGIQPVKHARHVRVYVRQAGEWMNVAHQATEYEP